MTAHSAKRKKASPANWMSLVEASQVLRETRLKVLTRVVKGELTAQHIAGRTLIDRTTVERIATEKAA